MKKITLFLLFSVLVNQAFSFDKELYRMIIVRDSIEQSLKYKVNLQELPCYKASIYVPAGFKLLDASISQFLIPQIWKNSTPANLQATLYPENGGPFDSRNERYAI
ncbi:MAG: hypothetical protein HYZ42_12865, partial [Bacteroidetes bacterium]|nr:hypothetical protein [Bacteroidota bacterium]